LTRRGSLGRRGGEKEFVCDHPTTNTTKDVDVKANNMGTEGKREEKFFLCRGVPQKSEREKKSYLGEGRKDDTKD